SPAPLKQTNFPCELNTGFPLKFCHTASPKELIIRNSKFLKGSFLRAYSEKVDCTCLRSSPSIKSYKDCPTSSFAEYPKSSRTLSPTVKKVPFKSISQIYSPEESIMSFNICWLLFSAFS